MYNGLIRISYAADNNGLIVATGYLCSGQHGLIVAAGLFMQRTTRNYRCDGLFMQRTTRTYRCGGFIYAADNTDLSLTRIYLSSGQQRTYRCGGFIYAADNSGLIVDADLFGQRTTTDLYGTMFVLGIKSSGQQRTYTGMVFVLGIKSSGQHGLIRVW